MRVLILGHKGNMGRRYSAILDWMGVEWYGYDIADLDVWDIRKADKVIVATPTGSHYDDCRKVIMGAKDFLCEKPISKDMEAVTSLSLACRDAGVKGFMVNNWAFLSRAKTPWTIVYNYYNTGRDGLYWDLIQPLYLSGGKCMILNKSPVFEVYVNCEKLSQRDFDWSYIYMVNAFLAGDYGKLWDMADAVKATEIVLNKIKEG